MGEVLIEPDAPVVAALPSRPAHAPLELITMSGDNVGALFGALAAAQGEFGSVERTLTAKITGKATYTYDYETLADLLEAVRPALSKNGLALMQFPTTRSRGVVVRTLLGHSSGQWIASDLGAEPGGLDPQAVGSAITYLRRYALKSILGLAPDVDDGGAAAAGAPKPAQRLSQQADSPQATPAQAQAAPAPAPPAPSPASNGDALPNVGLVMNLAERSDGMIVRLSTGFTAATRSAEIMASLKRHQTSGQVVELVTKPSRDPAKYAPTITEIILQSREPGQDG